jgi:hypothetical protein
MSDTMVKKYTIIQTHHGFIIDAGEDGCVSVPNLADDDLMQPLLMGVMDVVRNAFGILYDRANNRGV